jgi:hypothetical protein
VQDALAREAEQRHRTSKTSRVSDRNGRGASESAHVSKVPVGVPGPREDKGNLCGAKKRDGGRCKNFAGQNTNHKGIGACWLHGGRMKSSRRKAEVVKTERALMMLDPIDGDINPADVMIELLRVSVARARWLNRNLTALDPEALYELEGQVLAKFDGDERDRGARVARYCLEAGVPEFRVRIEQGQVETMVQMIKLGLTRIGAPAHYAAALGAALRIEGLTAAAEATGEPVDQDELAQLEAELARILAEHEPVTDAVVVEPESAEVVDAEPEPIDAEPEFEDSVTSPTAGDHSEPPQTDAT